MVELGLMQEDERVELIGGELVPMSPKGNHHEVLKAWLLDHWYRSRPDHVMLVPETTFCLSEDTYLEPDVVVYPVESGIAGLSAETALLVVEIADTSLAFDRGRKAELYAGFGIAELWVIDAVRRRTWVHRDPQAGGYRTISEHGPEARLSPQAVPDLSMRLAELDQR